MATLYGVDNLQVLLDSKAEVGIVANIALRHVAEVLNALKKSNKLIVLNIDSCEGLSQDKGAIEACRDWHFGAAVDPRSNNSEGCAMRPLYHAEGLRDRPFHLAPQSESNLAERTQSGADHAINMLDTLSAEDKRRLPPVVASGFICNETDVKHGNEAGAIAVSSSNKSLWDYKR